VSKTKTNEHTAHAKTEGKRDGSPNGKPAAAAPQSVAALVPVSANRRA
jgi:hypothetical protein